MYDNTCKFIAETFPADLATWLLGEPISLTKLEPSELSVEPIRADSLIFLESEEIILHAEFQTAPKPDIPFRMADYRLRAYRRYPGKQMRQIVIYLRQSGSDLVYQNTFEIENFRSSFEVIRLWEQPTEIFLQSPGLFPFAVLSQTNKPDNVLRQVAGQIEQISL
jgi:predicted transposase/invertase (TIGR01784 family)